MPRLPQPDALLFVVAVEADSRKVDRLMEIAFRWTEGMWGWVGGHCWPAVSEYLSRRVWREGRARGKGFVLKARQLPLLLLNPLREQQGNCIQMGGVRGVGVGGRCWHLCVTHPCEYVAGWRSRGGGEGKIGGSVGRGLCLGQGNCLYSCTWTFITE